MRIVVYQLKVLVLNIHGAHNKQLQLTPALSRLRN